MATDSQEDYLRKKALVADVLLSWRSEDLTFGQMADRILSAIDRHEKSSSKLVDAKDIERAIVALRRAYPYMPDRQGSRLVSEAADALSRYSKPT